MTFLLGVDGCRAGWLALRLDVRPDLRHGLRPSFRYEAIDLLLAERWTALPWREAERVAVDMPLGLADAGPRACDIAARRLLPAGRKSSVFPPPRRYMLACADWREAQDLGLAREGVGLSKQAWNITAKIGELDAALAPADQAVVREVHPELVFHRLNGWQALAPKRTPEGQAARLALLTRAGLPDLAPWLDRFPRQAAGRDDVIDAAACAFAARRLAAGEADRLPPDPPRDSRGLRMEIWY